MANELITVGSNSYEKVKTFKYLVSLLTNQNYIHKEIKCSLDGTDIAPNFMHTIKHILGA